MRDESTGERTVTAAALERFEEFRRRVLPSVWRRILLWKGIDVRRREDLLQDLEHAILADCLAHAEAVVKGPLAACHKRWLRVLQHEFYRSVERSLRASGPADDLDSMAGHPAPGEIGPALAGLELMPAERRLLARVLAHARHLDNGRLSIESTARATGVSSTRVRKLWLRIAARLDRGNGWVAFRRSRLAEALCAMAAAHIRSAPALDPSGGTRHVSPDIARRRARKIVRALETLPLDGGLRSVLVATREMLRESREIRSSHELLDLAERIAPYDVRIALWRAEAARDDGDLRDALGALRRARQGRADPTAVVIGRIRVLLDRGRWTAARSLLERARRRRLDARLRSVEAELTSRLRDERAPLRHAPSVDRPRDRRTGPPPWGETGKG